MIRRTLALSLLVAGLAVAQEEPKHPYDLAREAHDKTMAKLKQESAGNADMLVLDYVVADRKAGTVTLFGCTTGIGGPDPVEFFVTPGNSGKDYESLAITFAKPSDVHKGLEFIGLKPGRPVNAETNHYWPRGPRVSMSIETGGQTVRVEEMVIETERKTPLPQTGFHFTGSYTYRDEQGVSHYAADATDSKTIAPNYNDPTAVLDLPRRASQSEVYGFQTLNPKFTLTIGQLARGVLRPSAGDEAAATRDLSIAVKPGTPSPTYAVVENSTVLAEPASLPELVTALAEQAKSRADLFTSVSVDPRLLVTDVRKTFAVLQAIEQDRGVKLDPPPAGQLFQRAFFPDEQWRRREDRLGEPWELFLARRDGKIVARLERQMDVYEPEQKTILQRYDIADPKQFAAVVTENATQWSKAIFVYPPADLTCEELMTWATPVIAAYPRLFVFPAVEPTTQPATP